MIFYYVGLFFVLGIIFGSFINAAIYRLYKKESIVGSRSHCVHCSYQLRVKDLIPLGSFLILRGKCRSCSQAIPKDYFLVELILGLLFAYAGYRWLGIEASLSTYTALLTLVRDLFVVSVLVFLFVYDAKYYLLPDAVTLPSIAILFVIQFILGFSLYSLLLAIVVGAGFFALQYIISKGKWIGGGDIRLGALMGVIVGWPVIVVALFLAYIIGAPVAMYLMISGKKKMSSKIPFGTFLAISTIISFWYGNQILQWYLSYL